MLQKYPLIVFLTEILEKERKVSYLEFLYMGARDHLSEGVWRTTESEYKCGLQFNNWYLGQPNNGGGGEDCAAMSKRNKGKWDDIGCTEERYSLCQLLE